MARPTNLMVASLLTTSLQVLKSTAADLLSASEGLECTAHNTQSVKLRFSVICQEAARPLRSEHILKRPKQLSWRKV